MSGSERGDQAQRTLDAVWRIESARLIAALTRVSGDLGLAEDMAQDAFEAALRQWPRDGIPANPAAWLMTTAKRRAIDVLRRRSTQQRKAAEVGHQAELEQPDLDELVDQRTIDDDLLRLVFICCHPVLTIDSRVALTLRLLGGLRTDEVARAFLVSESAMTRRISRAKRTLSEARVPFEVPQGADFESRLGSVLQVVYLVFNEGYAATSGDGWVRPALCEDALRLGRVLSGLVPGEPEVHGLVALMEIQASRIRARIDFETGAPLPLLEQDRGRWDRLLIERGLVELAHADSRPGPRGPYTLQAAIAACHGRARTPDETAWAEIVALYDALAALTPSPVIELNRAVAVSMAEGPAAGLELVDAIADDPALANYHLLPAVRGDMLERLDRCEEATIEFARAATLTRNGAERDLLLARARAAGHN
jgi:RNA polymerase sigma factor (sigma-70 family)